MTAPPDPCASPPATVSGPPGQSVFVDDAHFATALAWASDGRLFFAERSGAIRVAANGTSGGNILLQAEGGTNLIAGTVDRSASFAAWSNSCSNHSDTPISPSETFRAHSTYSSRRLTDQSGGGLAAMALKLLLTTRRNDQIGHLRWQEAPQPAHALDFAYLLGYALFELLV